MRWRRLLVALHRDLGFLAIGLTLVYAVSGVAVNHRHDWDANYVRTHAERPVGRPAELLGVPGADIEQGQLAREAEEALVGRLVAALGRDGPPRKAFWSGPDRLSLFYGPSDTDVVDYHPSTGVAELATRRDRPILRALNVLHLNEPRGAWTWLADGYAAILVFLALSGALVVRGRRGLRGRGGVLTVLGILLPLVALWVVR